MDTSTHLHRRLWELIPWVVNGSAAAGERQAVEEHLHTCADCRDEYAFHRCLQAGIAMEPPGASDIPAQPGLQRLLARIDADPDRGAVPIDAPRQREARRRGFGGRALIAAVVVQAVGLALLATVLWQREHGDADARYETLSRAAEWPSPATIRLVPAPTLTLGELQALLADAGLHIVESNPGGSIYGLAPDADAPAASSTAGAIERLRSRPGILLVEPIAAPAGAAR